MLKQEKFFYLSLFKKEQIDLLVFLEKHNVLIDPWFQELEWHCLIHYETVMDECHCIPIVVLNCLPSSR